MPSIFIQPTKSGFSAFKSAYAFGVCPAGRPTVSFSTLWASSSNSLRAPPVSRTYITSPPSATTISPMHRPMSRPMAQRGRPSDLFFVHFVCFNLVSSIRSSKGAADHSAAPFHGWFMVCLTCLLYAFSIAHR